MFFSFIYSLILIPVFVISMFYKNNNVKGQSIFLFYMDIHMFFWGGWGLYIGIRLGTGVDKELNSDFGILMLLTALFLTLITVLGFGVTKKVLHAMKIFIFMQRNKKVMKILKEMREN